MQQEPHKPGRKQIKLQRSTTPYRDAKMQPSLRPVTVEITGGLLLVTLADGRLIGVPLDWYPELEDASPTSLAHFDFGAESVVWPELGITAEVDSMLRGLRPTVQTITVEVATGHRAILQHLERIEAEMEHLGLWQAEPLPPEAFDFAEAFAADTMSFPQWLQFVYVPNVRHAAEHQHDFPPSTAVSDYAAEAFAGYPDLDPVVTLLADLDALFGLIDYE